MSLILYLALAAPVIVTVSCLAVYRTVRADYLLYWAVAHTGLVVTFFSLYALGARWPAPTDPIVFAPLLGSQLLTWGLLFGIFNLATGRLLVVRGWPYLLGVSAAVAVAPSLSPAVPLNAPLALSAVEFVVAGLYLIYLRRSWYYVMGGLIIVGRGVNSFAAASIVAPGTPLDLHTVLPTSIFVNLLTGMMLMAIPVDDMRRRATETSRQLGDQAARLEDQARRLEELNVRYRTERESALQADRAKTQFLANMSHELRTPLNAVIGFSEILTRQSFGPLTDKYLEYAKDILASGQHLLNVINDILDISHIEAGTQTLSPVATDLASIIESSVKLVRLRAERRGQILTSFVDPDTPVTQIDSRAIKQVLLNLLSNAVKFTPEGGRITLRCRRDPDGWIAVSVADNGRGIAPDNVERVFQPFWQAEQSQLSRKHEGTGLGLAISKKLIELHGGTIALDSKEGYGTTVIFRLPPGCAVDQGRPAGSA